MNVKTLGRQASRIACAVMGLALAWPAQGAGRIQIDETKWISLGAGARSSFNAVEEAAPNGDDYSTDFNVDDARIYINGQIHKYVKLEFNTECLVCNKLKDFDLLDAIGKFEFSPYINIWAGRLLVPSERVEMDGPFYVNVYEGFKTPFYPSDFSIDFGDGSAGAVGRDHGVNLWGALADGRLQYVFGIFDGLNSATGVGPNQEDHLLYAARVGFNFLNLEPNPGYYKSSTYYGSAGDIFSIFYAVQYQEDGSGSFAHPGDFLGMSVDVLLEKVLANHGVVTLEGEYKNFDSDFDVAAFADGDCFCMFDGDAYTATALYLFPNNVGFGKVQPYVRYSGIDPDESSFRREYEAGVNYIIDGHNARLSLFYQYGDIASKSIVDFAPGVTGDNVSAIKLGFQLQL